MAAGCVKQHKHEAGWPTSKHLAHIKATALPAPPCRRLWPSPPSHPLKCTPGPQHCARTSILLARWGFSRRAVTVQGHAALLPCACHLHCCCCCCGCTVFTICGSNPPFLYCTVAPLLPPHPLSPLSASLPSTTPQLARDEAWQRLQQAAFAHAQGRCEVTSAFLESPAAAVVPRWQCDEQARLLRLIGLRAEAPEVQQVWLGVCGLHELGTGMGWTAVADVFSFQRHASGTALAALVTHASSCAAAATPRLHVQSIRLKTQLCLHLGWRAAGAAGAQPLGRRPRRRAAAAAQQLEPGGRAALPVAHRPCGGGPQQPAGLGAGPAVAAGARRGAAAAAGCTVRPPLSAGARPGAVPPVQLDSFMPPLCTLPNRRWPVNLTAWLRV